MSRTLWIAATTVAVTAATAALAARVLTRLVEQLDTSARAVHAELQASVDDPASAGTDWTWLTGHPAPPHEPSTRDRDLDIEALARALSPPCDRHWMIADNGQRVDLPVITCPQCVRGYYTTGEDARA